MEVKATVPKWIAEKVKEKAAARGLNPNEVYKELLREGLEIAKAKEVLMQRSV